MKLVIDIPKEVYKCVMDGTYCGTLYEELKNGAPVDTRGDCISRHAAITEICCRGVEAEKEGIMYMTMVDAKQFFVDAIESLPAVDPSTDSTTTDGGSSTDCISREAVLDLFAEKCDTLRPYHEVWKAVKKLPSVEPERKRGKWIKVVDEKTDNSTTWHYKCSLCESRKGWADYDYCPNCGAKMEVSDG